MRDPVLPRPRDPHSGHVSDNYDDAVAARLKHALLAALDACDPPVEVSPGVYAGTNLSELLAEALTLAAQERGGVEALVRHRPGCWEADHVRALAAGG